MGNKQIYGPIHYLRFYKRYPMLHSLNNRFERKSFFIQFLLELTLKFAFHIGQSQIKISYRNTDLQLK